MHGLRRRLLPRRLPAGQPDPGVERARRRRRLADRDRAAARDEQLPRVHRLAVPGAVRGVLRARHQRRPGRHQAGRAGDHRPRLRRGLGAAAAGGRAHRPAGGGHRLRAGRAGLRPAADPGRPRRHRLRAVGPARRPAPLRHPGLQDAQGPHRPAARPAGRRGHRAAGRRRHRRPGRPRPGRAAGRRRRRRARHRCAAAPGARDPRPRARRRPPGDGLPAAGQPGPDR